MWRAFDVDRDELQRGDEVRFKGSTKTGVVLRANTERALIREPASHPADTWEEWHKLEKLEVKD